MSELNKRNMAVLMADVVDHFGGQYKLAAALNVSSVAVNAWMKREAFPPKRAIEIETLTNRKFKAIDLIGVSK
jgi:DNA-binding transcriptional regulator YdaS (Cro superfamily)